MLTASTRLVAILGYPVEHSLSPVMHNAAFAASQLNFAYVACGVHPDRVGDAVAGLRALNFAGANVTIPHKEAVLPHLDSVSETVRRIGAVNTIVHRDGRLHGDNTDCSGFRRSLEADLAVRAEGSTCVVLGAGGAARAILVALADAGARAIIVANRTVTKAEALANEMLSSLGACAVEVAPLDNEHEMRAVLAGAGLAVNCTSVGMSDEASPVPVDHLAEACAVYDTIYTRETALVRGARERGLKAVNGLGMLLYQGAEAFEQWTGMPAPVDVMRDALGEALAAHR